MYTRKNRTRRQRGSGMLDFLTGSSTPTVNQQISALKGRRNYNLKHSKSRVANILSTKKTLVEEAAFERPEQAKYKYEPAGFKYTNKERIESKYQEAIEKLKTIEKPAETASALKTIANKLETALQSEEARTAGAITITIPVGIAQLAWKGMWIFLAALALVFVDLPSMGSIPLSASLMPNRNFNTTRNVYSGARKFTGANK